MTSISIVVTAPRGLGDCVYLDDLRGAAGGHDVDIVVTDGAAGYAGPGRVDVRHIRVPDAGIQTLIAEGVRHATGEWVIVTEDHCRALPEFVASYRRAILENPETDLLAGAVENLTSTRPWAFALFLAGLGRQWARAPHPPVRPSNANMAVRASAILPSERALDGGLLNLTVPRLIAAGRYGHCPEAVVDHVLALSGLESVAFQFHCASGSAAVKRDTLPAESLIARLWSVLRSLIVNVLIRPWRIVRTLPGDWPARPALVLRLMALGLTTTVAGLSVDLTRLARSLAPAFGLKPARSGTDRKPAIDGGGS